MTKKIIFLYFILFFSWSCPAFSANKVVDYRIADKEKSSRIVFDMEKMPKYSIFMLKNPKRIVLDIEEGDWDNSKNPIINSNRIIFLRTGLHDGKLRLVIETSEKSELIKHFALSKEKDKPYRLVVDLGGEAFSDSFIPVPQIRGQNVTTNNSDTNIPKPILRPNKESKKIPIPVIKKVKPKKRPKKKPIIVIDAGHGGHDPGSIGRRRTREKSVTIAYALELFQQLKDTKRYDPVLTRNRDVFLPLRVRVKKAKENKGDLFISLHADSHNNKRVKGLSVYTLSDSASDKEAAALARKENKADVIKGAGVLLKNEDEEVSQILIDLVQRDTMNLSSAFAEELLKELKKNVRVLRNAHRFAGFRVLTAADIPSVLIELGYLSNREEEKLLISKKYKKKLVKSIVMAIDNYYRNNNI